MSGYLDRIHLRSTCFREIRQFFHQRGFTEVDTPCLLEIPSIEPHIDPFEVRGAIQHHFLRTSPEYSIKKLIAKGMRNLFVLGSCFRDEPKTPEHNPEFTMLEWYADDSSLFDLMGQTEALIQTLWARLGCPGIERNGSKIDLSQPFKRMTVSEAFRRFTGLCPIECNSFETLRHAARKKGLRYSDELTDYDDLFFQLMLNYVEPQLATNSPVFLWGYPSSQAALSRLDPEDERRALRFELYIGGLELANAFDELRCSTTQRLRFISEQNQRMALKKTVFPLDEALIDAVGRMPQTSGIALGVDRLLMLLTNESTIERVRI